MFLAMNTIKGEKFQHLDNGINIFYRHIHESYNFFKNPPSESFVLITHNGDGRITNNPTRFNHGNSMDIDFNLIQLPKNLVKWYSQNVDVISDVVESIPIGLENSMWFPEIGKESKILALSYTSKTFNNLMYINHNISTNPSERLLPYELFSGKEWATVVHGSNGSGFNNYINNIHSHKFILCPEGNGIDTHRTWETLYVGSIPIEKKNLNNRFYTDLPICFVDKWEDITEDFLNYEYDRINSVKWNLEKLDIDFWKNKINNTL
jgi:hypothetical protein